MWLSPGLAAVTTARDVAEARGLTCDGLVTRSLPGRLVACDVGHSSADRASALAPLVPAGGTLVLVTAAWVHLGGVPPVVVDVALAVPRHSRDPRIRLRITQHRADGTCLRGCVRVTTPLQTATDLVRAAGPLAATRPGAVDRIDDDARGAPEIAAFRALIAAGVDTRAVRQLLLSEPRRAGHRLALGLLDRLGEAQTAEKRVADNRVGGHRAGTSLFGAYRAPEEPETACGATPGMRLEGTGAASGRTPVTR